jgi:hypothetical protein
MMYDSLGAMLPIASETQLQAYTNRQEAMKDIFERLTPEGMMLVVVVIKPIVVKNWTRRFAQIFIKLL